MPYIQIISTKTRLINLAMISSVWCSVISWEAFHRWINGPTNPYIRIITVNNIVHMNNTHRAILHIHRLQFSIHTTPICILRIFAICPKLMISKFTPEWMVRSEGSDLNVGQFVREFVSSGINRNSQNNHKYSYSYESCIYNATRIYGIYGTCVAHAWHMRETDQYPAKIMMVWRNQVGYRRIHEYANITVTFQRLIWISHQSMVDTEFHWNCNQYPNMRHNSSIPVQLPYRCPYWHFANFLV